ncbi:MAG TPA: hypothetical protein VHG91_07525 [Longimicrobium sp.]|nr:hypothetical protein [Longimicrobium sp.]
MRFKHAAVLTLLAPIFAAACDSTESPTGPGASAPQQAATPAAPGQQKARGIEARFAELERQVPGFGGYFYDADGALTAYVTDPRSEGQARAALAQLQREGKEKAGAPIRVRQGRYAFGELSRWNEKLTGVFAERGVVYTDLDEATNRLRVGVENLGLEKAVRQRAERAGIPAEALEVSQAEPVKPLATLQDLVLPVQGGLQITWYRGASLYVCTLGHVVDNTSYITNSHCSATQGAVDGTIHYQNLPGAAIGSEVADPGYWSGGPCPAGWFCRYSDSSKGTFNPGVPFAWHTVANTTGIGSLTIAGAYNIIGEQAFPTLGQSLTTVGRTSGKRVGNVIQTCAHVQQAGTPIVLLCQDRVGASSAGGDSGSPVIVDLGGGNAYAAGILWGGGTGNYVFSAVANIEADLGPLAF